MTTPSEIHRKVQILTELYAVMDAGFRTMQESVKPLLEDSDPDTAWAAREVVLAVDHLIALVNRQGEAKIAKARRLLACPH